MSASGTTFYDATGSVTASTPVTSARILPDPVGEKVTGPATVVLTAKDAAGIASTEYSLDGGAFQLYEGPFTVSTLGDHTVEYPSTNREGAVEKAKEISFSVVTHDPPVTSARILPEPVEGKVTGPATVVLSATENGGGVTSTEFNLDGAGFQPYDGPFTVSGFGDHTVEFRSTNRDGVVETAKQVTFTVAPHLAPSTTAAVLPEPVDGKVTGPARVVLTAHDNGGGVASTEVSVDGAGFQPYDGPFTVSGFSDHTVEYRSTNGDGVVEATQQVTFTVVAHDPPVTSASVAPNPVEGKVTGPATVTLSATENGGGVAKTEFNVDGGAFQEYTGPFTVSGFAAHTVEYRSTNRDGAVEATKQVSFTIVAHDAPVTSAAVLPTPVDGNVTGPATVTLSATENGGGVAKTEFNVDGGAFQEYTGPFTVSGFSAHTVEYRSTNRDGAVEETKQVSFTIIGHAAPVTTASVQPEPVNGKITGGPAKVLLAATDSGSDVTATEFKLDGGAFQPYTGSIAVSGFRTHTVEYHSTNADGVVEATKQVEFTIVPHDAPVTSASILPQPAGGKVTGSATLVLAATENGGGVARTEFKLDAGAFQPYVGPITVSTLGDHTINYRSTNRDEVVEATKEIKFTVVAPPPPPAPKPVCAEPHLSIAVSHPLRHSKGLVTLLQGRAYRYTGHLTCGAAHTPAPEGTVISVTSVVGGHASGRPGIAVGGAGKIDTLLLFSGKRTVVFGFASNGASAQASIRIAVVRH